MTARRVLHITQATIGGTLEYLRLLLPRLEEYQHEIACPAYGPMQHDLRELGFRLHTVTMAREISALSDVRAAFAIRKLIVQRRPGLVHLHSSKAGVVGRLAAAKLDVPVVYTPHGWSFGMNVSPLKKRIYASIERACERAADAIVNISPAESRLANTYRIGRATRMVTMMNAIDPSPYLRSDTGGVRAALGIPDDAFVVGMVGRLVEQKAPLSFLRAALKIVSAVPNAYFVVVGDGELRSRVEAFARSPALRERFLLTGWVSNVSDYLRHFDVAVLPSLWEPFGLVILEYMAAGKPVVASSVGGIQDIVTHGQDGLLARAGDVDELAQRVVELHRDASLRARLAAAGRTTLRQRFSIENLARQHAGLYESLMSTS